ncbi:MULTISPECIES: hypothetical protein [Cyanophyceae]|uniref:hypothetical protein n=1 Tax=Cyanophyceae TaxID=3028117 RepID=UPI0016827266|nr:MULTISPECIES: hypothetical protein [Cyanophyceae]MBD1917948.1 hypothetical protein [Phormidium sp. FACHB-77]MBD2029196.1 hypothetical protein [Phormidium sp. FACHB-322]MBD2049728.1 hypothetical protein [Leptolyngbya sp. FACHB-60]
MSSFSSDLTGRDYEVRIGDYFSRGWEIFKAKALLFVLFTLLLLLIQVVISILPPPIGTRAEGSSEITILFSPIGDNGGILSLAFNIISPALTAGYYFVAFQIARNRDAVFNDFFRGFNKFLPIFLVTLVSTVLIVIGSVLLILPGVYLAVAYLFAQPLVIDKNADFWQAMETSRKLITKKWFSFFGLLLLIFLLNIGGVILLGFGLLVTIPLSICIIAAAYEDIVGLNSVSDVAV